MSNNFNNQDFDVRTLSDFQTWSDAALRCYLSLRKRKLLVDGYVIPDPFGIRGGWLEESDSSRASWPAIFITDIAQYLKAHSAADLVDRLCSAMNTKLERLTGYYDQVY